MPHTTNSLISDVPQSERKTVNPCSGYHENSLGAECGPKWGVVCASAQLTVFVALHNINEGVTG